MPMDNHREIVDLLILGCGVAGSVAALEAATNSTIEILVVTPQADPHETNTYYAQGGIIGRGPEDSVELLAEDLYRAGAEINHPNAVELLAQVEMGFKDEFEVKTGLAKRKRLIEQYG